MELAKITAKGQTTIPKAIRDRLGLHEGDRVSFEVEGDHLVVRKVVPRHGDADYLAGVESTLDEWLSDADENAYREL